MLTKLYMYKTQTFNMDSLPTRASKWVSITNLFLQQVYT